MTRSQGLLGALFIVAGIAHFLRPEMYMRIMPPWLPAPMALVLISGVFEVAGGVGVLLAATRTMAAWGLIALLVAVFPANIQMLVNAIREHGSGFWIAALVARLPLQPLMAWWLYASSIRKP